jgi:hypothetical protein
MSFFQSFVGRKVYQKLNIFLENNIYTPFPQIHKNFFIICLYVFEFSIYLYWGELVGLLMISGVIIIQITMVEIFESQKVAISFSA